MRGLRGLAAQAQLLRQARGDACSLSRQGVADPALPAARASVPAGDARRGRQRGRGRHRGPSHCDRRVRRSHLRHAAADHGARLLPDRAPWRRTCRRRRDARSPRADAGAGAPGYRPDAGAARLDREGRGRGALLRGESRRRPRSCPQGRGWKRPRSPPGARRIPRNARLRSRVLSGRSRFATVATMLSDRWKGCRKKDLHSPVDMR